MKKPLDARTLRRVRKLVWSRFAIGEPGRLGEALDILDREIAATRTLERKTKAAKR